MAQHTLSLDVPDTMNLCQLRIVDTSIYNPDIPITCQILEVTMPGFTQAVQFGDTEITEGFIENLTTCDLKTQVTDCGTTYDTLPDGIYIIKWSVSPNDLVYVEYNHLRMVIALNQYNAILCELDIQTCAPTAELEKKMKDLNQIRMYLSAAKAMVEICHEPKKGMELYNYAVKLLNKYECKTCRN